MTATANRIEMTDIRGQFRPTMARNLLPGDWVIDEESDGQLRRVDRVESHTSTRGVRGVIVWFRSGGFHSHPEALFNVLVDGE